MPFINGGEVPPGAIPLLDILRSNPPGSAARLGAMSYGPFDELYTDFNAIVGNTSFNAGFCFNAFGALYCVDATAGVPAGSQIIDGIARTAAGAMCTTTNLVGSYVHGWPVDAQGRVAVLSVGQAPGAFTFFPISIEDVPQGLRLEWTASVGVEDYEVRRDGVVIATLGPDELFFDEQIVPGTYVYAVTALNAIGGTASTPPTHTTAPGDWAQPVPPFEFFAAEFNDPVVSLWWEQATNAKTIEVQRDGQIIVELGGSDAGYDDYGFTPDTTHTYEIFATNAAGITAATGNPIQVFTG